MKKQIRQRILTHRESLSNNEVSKKSRSISQKLKKMPIYCDAKNIMIYIDFRKEVKTVQIINDLLESNKNVIVPATVPETKTIIPSELHDPKKELEKTNFGVLEPKKEYIKKSDPDKLDLIILPCVAFSLQGYRIGYGAGYYDRFFAKLQKNICTIGLAFDLQIIDSFTPEPHDLKVDTILTETKIIKC